jgi:uncharacterized protein (DUF2141 family)
MTALLLLLASALLASPAAPSAPPAPAASAPAAPAADTTVVVTIAIDGAENDDGQVVVMLFADDDGFPGDGEAAAHRVTAPLTQGRARVVVEGVTPGRYAVSAFHDDDSDGAIDTNFLGIPKDGITASNWDGGRPRFRTSALDITEATTLNLTLKY